MVLCYEWTNNLSGKPATPQGMRLTDGIVACPTTGPSCCSITCLSPLYPDPLARSPVRTPVSCPCVPGMRVRSSRLVLTKALPDSVQPLPKHRLAAFSVLLTVPGPVARVHAPVGACGGISDAAGAAIVSIDSPKKATTSSAKPLPASAYRFQVLSTPASLSIAASSG